MEVELDFRLGPIDMNSKSYIRYPQKKGYITQPSRATPSDRFSPEELLAAYSRMDR